MEFSVIIPARLASTRLPHKPLADLGGAPIVVRVAQRAAASGATRVVVAADSDAIVAACRAHGVDAVLTSPQHATGTDRLAEAATQLALPDDAIVVNVQGDEPLIPPPVIERVARRLHAQADCAMATAACPLTDALQFFDPNVVKVVTDRSGRALLFSRGPIPWARDAFARDRSRLPDGLPARRHIGIYAFRVAFLRAYPGLPRDALEIAESLEQLRALAHGYRIAVEDFDAALPPGVDTPEDLQRVRAIFAGRG